MDMQAKHWQKVEVYEDPDWAEWIFRGDGFRVNVWRDPDGIAASITDTATGRRRRIGLESETIEAAKQEALSRV